MGDFSGTGQGENAGHWYGQSER